MQIGVSQHSEKECNARLHTGGVKLESRKGKGIKRMGFQRRDNKLIQQAHLVLLRNLVSHTGIIFIFFECPSQREDNCTAAVAQVSQQQRTFSHGSFKQRISPIPSTVEMGGGIANMFSNIERQSNLRRSHWKITGTITTASAHTRTQTGAAHEPRQWHLNFNIYHKIERDMQGCCLF